MLFRPFHRFETGCAAYVFGCGTVGKGCVVDPHEADLDAYVAFADARGLRITHVFDTHVHADHRSGARTLAARTGAAHVMHRSADVGFEFVPADDGQEIELGNTVVKVLHTPGHTAESVCLLVTDLRRGRAPWFVCTGDTLFVGAVGRPDLPGHERVNAAELHRSLRDKLFALPDDVEIYPAHFAGSACGAGMSGKPMSTIGFERRWNPLVGLDADEFVRRVADGMPAKPPGMVELLRQNRGAP